MKSFQIDFTQQSKLNFFIEPATFCYVHVHHSSESGPMYIFFEGNQKQVLTTDA